MALKQYRLRPRDLRQPRRDGQADDAAADDEVRKVVLGAEGRGAQGGLGGGEGGGREFPPGGWGMEKAQGGGERGAGHGW